MVKNNFISMTVLLILLLASCHHTNLQNNNRSYSEKNYAYERYKSICLNDYKTKTKNPIKIDSISENASGLTYNQLTKTLFLVVNRPTKIVELELNGETRRVINLNEFSDTEGIVYVGNNTYAVIEEDRYNICLFEINDDTTNIDYNSSSVMAIPDIYKEKNKGLEGISYDSVSKDFFIVKEMHDRKIYRLSNKNKPDISFPWDIQKNSLNLKDLSGIYYHSILKNLLILSDESKSVVEATLKGVEISRLELTKNSTGLKKDIPQAEGITMDDNDTLYICSEPNLLYIFTKTR